MVLKKSNGSHSSKNKISLSQLLTLTKGGGVQQWRSALGNPFRAALLHIPGPVTFQHAEVHGVVGSLGHAEHHLQAVFNLPFPFLTAREQLLRRTLHEPGRD